MNETDLYLPIKDHLESLGFYVQAEVGAIDVLAKKDEVVLAVELKRMVSLKLIYQAIDRQKYADKVYIAIPIEAFSKYKEKKSLYLLLKRLEIGLLVVNHNKVDVVIETFGFDVVKSKSASKRKKDQLLKEFSLRKTNLNLGGSSGKKMTHYKERVIQIALYLYEFGMKSPKEIKAYTHILDTQSILTKNYYMWFFSPERGQYTLSEIGKKDLLKLGAIHG